MLDDLRPRPIDAMRFEINTDRFSDLLQTTWIELEFRGLGEAHARVRQPRVPSDW
jgi:hypothetical protein